MDKEQLIKEANQQALKYITRRHFLLDCVAGMGSIALGSLMAGCGNSLGGTATGIPAIDAANPMAPRIPHFAPRAKSVIYLHMAGAPSQLELFDYKPELHKLQKKPFPTSLLEGNNFTLISGLTQLTGAQAHFKQYGECVAWKTENHP